MLAVPKNSGRPKAEVAYFQRSCYQLVVLKRVHSIPNTYWVYCTQGKRKGRKGLVGPTPEQYKQCKHQTLSLNKWDKQPKRWLAAESKILQIRHSSIQDAFYLLLFSCVPTGVLDEEIQRASKYNEAKRFWRNRRFFELNYFWMWFVLKYSVPT